MDLRKLLERFDLPEGWTVVRVLRNGHEEVLASGVTLDRASELAHQLRASCHLGEVISLREAWGNLTS